MSNFRRRLEIANKPYDAEIEYLESDGNQLMSVNNIILPTENDYITYIKCRRRGYLSSVSTYGGIIGSNNNILYRNGPYYVGFGYGTKSASIELRHDTVYNITLRSDYIELNNSIKNYTGSRSVTTQSYFNLFFSNVVLRLYSYKIIRGEDVICDFIPVRVGQVGYMYDKVSNQLFGNDGTGNFILGPDL